MQSPRPPEWYDAIDKDRIESQQFRDESLQSRKATAERLNVIERDLKNNTTMTSEMHDALGEAIPVILDLRGAARLMRRIGGVLTSRPVLICAALGASIVLWLKTGKWSWTPVP